MLPSALVNYLIASLLSAAGLLIFRVPMPHTTSLELGAATGVAYGLSLLALESAMRLSGVSIAVAVNQLSLLIPTVVSVLVFAERPNGLQYVGIAVAFVALPLLSFSSTIADSIQTKSRESAIVIFLLFAITGCAGVTIKMFQFTGQPQDQLAFTVATFAAATLVIALAIAVRHMAWGPSAWPVGSLIGMCNLLQLVATLQALTLFPAAVVFPITSALTVALSTLLSVRFWNERLSAHATVGIALAMLSAALLGR